MTKTILKTAFYFFGQSNIYHGKVRDVYTVGDLFISVATDRISAFDVILPRAIPFKGQVLNQLSAYFLDRTGDIVPNWLRDVPDPNVSVGVRAEPFKVEVIVRGCLVGSAWRQYKDGARSLCGVDLPGGLQEYDAFPEPILTPTTKAEAGHDEDISPEEIVAQRLATKQEWAQIAEYAQKLFARGQEMARDRGLMLADTKYEFGHLPDGAIILIDEVHTPDSSRYFYADGYDTYLADRAKEPPKHLSKEFVREWLMDKGFSGQAGQGLPDMDDNFVNSVSKRYIELYEQMTGQKFVKAETGDILKRIENNIVNYLENEHEAH